MRIKRPMNKSLGEILKELKYYGVREITRIIFLPQEHTVEVQFNTKLKAIENLEN